MPKQFDFLQVDGKRYKFSKKSSLWDEWIDPIKSLFIILLLIYISIDLIDYLINTIPELKYISINHNHLIKNINVIVPYIYEKVKKGSKINTIRVCACATIIAGLLSMNTALSIWGVFRLKKSYDPDGLTIICYHINGQIFKCLL